MSGHRSVSWIFWPFAALWNLLAFILVLTGRVVGATLGLVFMIVGLIATITLVGAPIGVPLTLFGFLLMLRSFL